MTYKTLKRGFLIVIGILSVAIIVLTQSFYQPVETHVKKANSERSADKNENNVTISAPSDVVPHGNAVALNQSTPSLAEKISGIEKPATTTLVIKKAFVTFFKTLFRVIIAPNAP